MPPGREPTARCCVFCSTPPKGSIASGAKSIASPALAGVQETSDKTAENSGKCVLSGNVGNDLTFRGHGNRNLSTPHRISSRSRARRSDTRMALGENKGVRTRFSWQSLGASQGSRPGRPLRQAPGSFAYHLLNRGNGYGLRITHSLNHRQRGAPRQEPPL